MKQKYHKIPNVALEVCTAEQKIAYNLAFAYGDPYRKEYHRMPMQFQKAEVITAAAREMLKLYRMGYDYKAGKYNEDMIHSSLLSGLENYFNFNQSGVVGGYEEIGKIFPASYLSK